MERSRPARKARRGRKMDGRRLTTRQILSPYRICPIGAHIDHQGGPVLGRTIKPGTTLEYSPLETREILIRSDQFGEARLRLGDEIDQTHWARYAQAAARVFGKQLRRGMQAHVSGALIGAGLSSSASVGLAYLKALADVNEIELPNERLVQMDVEMERGQLGLQNGILDPLTIVHGRKDALLFMETMVPSVSAIPDPPAGKCAWILAYSGVSRELTRSGFNGRVAECVQAAGLLKPGAGKLGEVGADLFEEKKMSLPENLRRRAQHFFSEVQRVGLGRQAWMAADLALFGQLMNQSCESSIRSYESGNEVIIQLQEITSRTNGILGSRFSGGGYGGCVVALAQPDLAESAAAAIAAEFYARHPELPSRVFVTETGDGLQWRIA
jgi:galactokinase